MIAQERVDYRKLRVNYLLYPSVLNHHLCYTDSFNNVSILVLAIYIYTRIYSTGIYCMIMIIMVIIIFITPLGNWVFTHKFVPISLATVLFIVELCSTVIEKFAFFFI